MLLIYYKHFLASMIKRLCLDHSFPTPRSPQCPKVALHKKVAQEPITEDKYYQPDFDFKALKPVLTFIAQLFQELNLEDISKK